MVGMITGGGVLVLLAYLAYLGMNHLATAKELDPQPGSNKPVNIYKDSPLVEDVIHPDRPSPELKGEMIIQADKLFRRARKAHNSALRAAEEELDKEHDDFIAECRDHLKILKGFLQDHQDWLTEAIEKEWPLPTSYRTLQKRLKKYGHLESALPSKDDKRTP